MRLRPPSGRAARLGIVLTLGLLSACDKAPEPVDSVRPALVAQPQATRADYSAYAGEIRARHEPALAFRVGGKLTRRLVEVGERVSKDQPLAELDPEDLGLRAEASGAQLAAAESDVALARSEFDRQQALRERSLNSASAFDSARARIDSAQARLLAAKADHAVNRNQASYAVLRAPADGVIAQRMAETGQVVAAGQAVFQLAEDGDREVLIALPEQTIAEISIGQPVQIQLWSQGETLLNGRIRELAPAADPASRTFAARVAIEGMQAPVELGQSARVFLASAAQATLRLPLAAVSATDGEPYVLKIDPASQRLQRVTVQLGAYGEDSVPVLSGIEAGDWVVAGGVHLLREGQQIRPVDRDNRPVDLGQAQ
jgi:multidrug efflux system membrane fusion protein